jgi:hypothetical protein
MTRTFRPAASLRAVALVALVVSFGAAAGAAAQQSPVPIRALSPALAKTSEPLGLVFGVRHLPDGRLLVNDARGRRILVFDSTLASYEVTIDSATGAAASYGPRPAPIIGYLGDSTLFVDMASQSLLVINPAGKIARVMAAPRPQELFALSQANAAVDAQGRLIYRTAIRVERPPPGPAGAPVVMPPPPDSGLIVRADFATRGLDTIARVKVASTSRMSVSTGPDGRRSVKMTVNPVPQMDEWAVLADGAVALVRGLDYHIDWINPDDTRTSSPKMPFDWRRLSDEDKQGLIDSARTAREEGQRRADSIRAAGGAAGAAGDGARMAMEMGATMVMRVDAVAAGGRGAAGPVSAPTMIIPEIDYVPLKDIPDYYPPIRAGAARGDLDGNLWILPTTSAQSVAGELVYDVVNRKGELFERVRIPAGRSIAGFGRGGIVYLMWRDGDAGWYIERTRILESRSASR